MLLLSANYYFFLPVLLAWTCLSVTASPFSPQAFFPASKAAVDAISVGWAHAQSLPFEVILSNAKEKGIVIAESALKDVADKHPDIANQVQQFQGHINKIVGHAKDLERELAKNNIDLMVVHDHLTREAANIVEILQTEFDQPCQMKWTKEPATGIR
ncbi:hypothetical protein EST38_g7043 [Candolleomyces aberdarensis]|uniref:Uncharacterized protein n=1 Tax=Candolleomyces aberdarensis TaxID=2316362 RepID=A0A4Q2DG54_9AGAR|nr:hypothetical protein EST38_g7043 [Candolleomyces aberdarensis]